jgi:flagellar export protein FliJ
MKAFQFRLQAVLTLREQAEQAAQQSCALAYAAVGAASARLRAADEAIVVSDESRRAQLSAGARADQIEQLRVFSVLLGERRAGRIRELNEAQQRAREAWSLLVTATQRREALERLRLGQRSVHTYQAARAEQKLLDELAGHSRPLAATWRETGANV